VHRCTHATWPLDATELSCCQSPRSGSSDPATETNPGATRFPGEVSWPLIDCLSVANAQYRERRYANKGHYVAMCKQWPIAVLKKGWRGCRLALPSVPNVLEESAPQFMLLLDCSVWTAIIKKPSVLPETNASHSWLYAQ
jgi:hypothetical protein